MSTTFKSIHGELNTFIICTLEVVYLVFEVRSAHLGKNKTTGVFFRTFVFLHYEYLNWHGGKSWNAASDLIFSEKIHAEKSIMVEQNQNNVKRIRLKWMVSTCTHFSFIRPDILRENEAYVSFLTISRSDFSLIDTLFYTTLT